MSGIEPLKQERRRFRPILSDQRATIHLKGRQYDTRVIDISLNGVLVQRPPDWPSGRYGNVMIKIFLDEGGTSIRLEAEFAHLHEDSVGFHSLRLGLESIAHLRRLVELNITDPQLLERELAALG